MVAELQAHSEQLIGVACGGVFAQDGILFSKIYLLRWGDSTCLRFFHDVWCRNHSLKELYPSLYACLLDQNASIHSIMEIPVGGKAKYGIYRCFHD